MALQNEGVIMESCFFMDYDERKEFGSSDVLEFQYCSLPSDTELTVIVDTCDFWKKDSLYVSNESDFYQYYGDIFTGGTYGNLNTGPLDSYGINYYPPELVKLIRARIDEEKPPYYRIIRKWLSKAGQYNGIYVYGA